MIQIGNSDLHKERKSIRKRSNEGKIKSLLLVYLPKLIDGSLFRVIRGHGSLFWAPYTFPHSPLSGDAQWLNLVKIIRTTLTMKGAQWSTAAGQREAARCGQ